MVDFKADERLNTLNHSCAHVMAQAVKHLYPEAKFWVGPVVKEGFYYDIDLGENAVNDDVIAAIEKEMKKICKEGKKIYRREISKAEALELFKNDEYKLDLISDLEDGTISVYDQGDFTDLCRGPHVDNTKLCKNFKLVKYSGVYWKGDANNHVMQRIYGVCFPTAEELEAHLKLLEEAKERDHRKIGKEMQLFMSDDLVGRGLPMFLPKGYTVWQELENYIKAKERKLGYLHVMTPCVGTVGLYKTSGHWDHYKENMYTTVIDETDFAIKPMNCPGGMLVYKNEPHSYRDLPLRMAELGLVLKILVLQRNGQLGADKLALACYGDGLAQGVRQTFQTGSSAGVEQVAVHGLRQGQLALDAVQAGCQNQPDDQIWVARRVRAAQLHAAELAVGAGQPHQLAAVLAAPAHILGGFAAAKPCVRVGNRVTEAGQLPCVGKDTGNKMSGLAVGGNVALEQVFAVPVDGNIHMHLSLIHI